MDTTTLRTGSLTALASLVLVGSGFVTTTSTAQQYTGDGWCCPTHALGPSFDIDDVVAARKMAAAKAFAARA